MKRTVKELRGRLASLIREIGQEPRRFARDPDRDFTRRRKLSGETLISALLCLGGGSLGQKLMDHFGQAAPPSPPSSSRGTNCCPWRWTRCSTASQTNWKRRIVGMAIASWPWTEHP